ncbi:MAG: hypothetical protein JWP27_256 [Flaviaesturariibacter sp.]|nr:hypothetical protein [Flaviaesturariibacter sp.]
MKLILASALAVLSLASCGNATDGDARTDTTNLPTDTGGTALPYDTANHVNSNTGEYPNDSIAGHNLKGDVRSSSPTNLNSRSTTPGNDTGRRH